MGLVLGSDSTACKRRPYSTAPRRNLNTSPLISTKPPQPFFKRKFQTRPGEGSPLSSRSIDFPAHCGGTNIQEPMCNHLSSIRALMTHAHNKGKLRNNLGLQIRRDTTQLAAPALSLSAPPRQEVVTDDRGSRSLGGHPFPSCGLEFWWQDGRR